MQLSAFAFLSVAAAVLAAPTATQTLIHPTSDTSKCLVAASNADGAAVQITDCVTGAHPESVNQLWTVTGGTLQIFGDKCLDDTNGVTTNGQKMQIFTCFSGNTNQKWAPTSSGSISLTGTNKCLDNTDGLFTNGNPTQIYDCTGGKNQKWTLSSVVVTPPPTGSHISPGRDGNSCLTAASNADNALVTITPCSDSAAQAWTVSGGSVKIFGNKCLDVPNGSTTNGVKMQIYTCFAGNTNQQFTVTADERIAWTNKGECLDLTNGSTSPGTPAQLWACTDGNENQVWTIGN